MYMTSNSTTTKVGQATATVLARTRHPKNYTEIITWELLYPRYIHAEFMTHRMFSRNACSSRATPVKTLIDQVRVNPVYFDEVRQNQKGMVGGELLDSSTEAIFHDLWRQGAQVVASIAEQMAALGVAKQTVNRILEPFLPIRVIVTATDTENFFNLRLAPDAQPEIQSLARAMRASRDKADLSAETIHMPYAEYFDEDDLTHKAIRCIAACARVSVARGNGRTTTFEDDLALVQRLRKSGHMTPFEHVAIADTFLPSMFANLRNWQSLRYRLEGEFLIDELPGFLEMVEHE